MLYIQETEGERGRAFGGDFVSAHLSVARVEERKKKGGNGAMRHGEGIKV